ncbi:MAG TPA: DUF559 domain-containing protein [Actinophytocola sp.]|uniref:DUF559 domain-containing protein n=1 Tax=Actinophytocola sp. TaxID=1872138 RepID=UPI002DDD2D3F|nr:DUF559 domain-containing protein [Actinophytocola sp.]HEV2784208.1 DUF559 domain-containing protein [Actinophytocola sp.]
MPESLHGAHLRRDLIAQFGRHAILVALRDGLLEQPWRGVIVARDQSARLETRAAAALLAVGERAVLSGPTAAALHGCTAAAECGDIHVTVPYQCRADSRRGLIVHHDRFAAADVTTRIGLPVLVLDLIIAELLCAQPRRLALACADQALAALPPSRREDFRAAVDDRLVNRDDRRGTRRAEVLLGLATGLAESPPESWLRLLVADAGFPLPEPQYEIRDLAGRLVYRLDLAWPDLRVALEYDGYEAHEGRAEADAERDRRLAGRGWVVIRVRARDLSKPDRVLAELRRAFEARGRAA